MTGDTGDDEKKAFDKEQAKAVLGQAARSAHTCVGVVSKDSPQGTGTVTVTFGHDGHVKKATIASAVRRHRHGQVRHQCDEGRDRAALPRAIEVTMEWKVDLSPEKKSDDSE